MDLFQVLVTFTIYKLVPQTHTRGPVHPIPAVPCAPPNPTSLFLRTANIARLVAWLDLSPSASHSLGQNGYGYERV